MAEYLNAVCKICGKKYHHCEKCEQIGSWRAEAASQEPVVEAPVTEESPTITYEDSRPAEDVYDADVSVSTEE